MFWVILLVLLLFTDHRLYLPFEGFQGKVCALQLSYSDWKVIVTFEIWYSHLKGHEENEYIHTANEVFSLNKLLLPSHVFNSSNKVAPTYIYFNMTNLH